MKALMQSKKLLCAVLLTALRGSAAVSGCGKAEEEKDAILVHSTLFGFARLGVAVIFHEGSTLIVVANALRLLRFKGD